MASLAQTLTARSKDIERTGCLSFVHTLTRSPLANRSQSDSQSNHNPTPTPTVVLPNRPHFEQMTPGTADLEGRFREIIFGNTPLSFSFAGCGFNGLYHVGVVACFKEYLPWTPITKVYGSSAGALAAMSLTQPITSGKHYLVHPRSARSSPTLHQGYVLRTYLQWQ